jgi:hypothetical protein
MKELTGENAQRLDEFTKDEWRDVARKVAPHMTDEEYDAAWEAFVALKKAREEAATIIDCGGLQ